MTDTAWKPTPGRDAMTRDGRRVTGLLRKPTFGNYVFVGEVDGATSTWTEVGKYYQAEGLSSVLDLIADWPDADPIPDADGWVKHTHGWVKHTHGWVKHTPGPCPVDPETVVEVRLRIGREWVGRYACEGSLWAWGDEGDTTITHYRIVRPAPSGPVVEETVKRIVPGRYGRLEIAGPVKGGYVVGVHDEVREFTRSEILAAAETLRQIGEAMEGK